MRHTENSNDVTDPVDAPSQGTKADEPELHQLRQDFDSLQAAHKSLLERIQEEGGTVDFTEIDALRLKVTRLEENLTSVTSERDELQQTVRDLRVRVEEGRRAIMRLQGRGEPGTSLVSPSLSNGASGNVTGLGLEASSSSTSSKIDMRRSIGPGALASWNPKEQSSGLGISGAASPSVISEATSSQHQTQEDVADVKKAKRASLAFGPYANTGTIGRRTGHRRNASGSKPPGYDMQDQSSTGVVGVESNTGGLRELRLGANPSNPTGNGTSSKRASMIGGSFFRSPASDSVDLPPEDYSEKSPNPGAGNLSQTVGSLLMPVHSMRRASNSSSISGKAAAREEAENTLTLPRSVSRMSGISASPSQASVSSADAPFRAGEQNEETSLTARPPSSLLAPNGTSIFGAQQQSVSVTQLQRNLTDSRNKLKDRDEQVHQLRKEMSALRAELDEAREGRQASEACLKALRDFVQSEGEDKDAHDGLNAEVLRGVKLPPLPTDKDGDQVEQEQDNSMRPLSTAPSTWKSFGSTIANFSSRKVPEEEKFDGVPSTNASQAANVSSSFGNLWSRATGPRESVMSSQNAIPGASNETDAGSIGGDHGSTVSGVSTSPSSGFKGFSWFGKRSVSTTSDAESQGSGAGSTSNVGGVESPTISVTTGARVSSPPFANLDNHVLTLDQTPVPPKRSSSSIAMAAAYAAGLQNRSHIVNKDDMEPTGRTRKAMEKSEAVDEDSGFVPPAF